jgi:ligand-binding sensor protein
MTMVKMYHKHSVQTGLSEMSHVIVVHGQHSHFLLTGKIVNNTKLF